MRKLAITSTPAKIFVVVEGVTWIGVERIRGRETTSGVVFARHLAAFLLAELTCLGIREVAAEIGRTDESTVRNAIWQTERRAAAHEGVAAAIDRCRALATAEPLRAPDPPAYDAAGTT